MRLIDELLKDDFFNGGYQPAAPAAAVKAAPVSSAPANKKPMILIAAVVGGLIVVGAGGFFFLSSGKKEAPSAQTVPAPVKPVAVVPAPAPQAQATPPPGAVEPAALPAEGIPTPVPELAVAESAPPAPVAAAVAEPDPAPVVTPPPAPPAPVVKAAVAPPPAPAPVAVPKPVVVASYTLVFPKFSDKDKAESIIAKLKAAGASPKLITGSDKTSAYRVKSAKNATAAESNAIKLKASIFKVKTTPNPQADGTISFDFGVFNSKAEAEAVVASTAKLAHDVAISVEKTSVPVYSIDAGKLPEDEAKAALGALGGDGDGVKLKKVK